LWCTDDDGGWSEHGSCQLTNVNYKGRPHFFAYQPAAVPGTGGYGLVEFFSTKQNQTKPRWITPYPDDEDASWVCEFLMYDSDETWSKSHDRYVSNKRMCDVLGNPWGTGDAASFCNWNTTTNRCQPRKPQPDSIIARRAHDLMAASELSSAHDHLKHVQTYVYERDPSNLPSKDKVKNTLERVDAIVKSKKARLSDDTKGHLAELLANVAVLPEVISVVKECDEGAKDSVCQLMEEKASESESQIITQVDVLKVIKQIVREGKDMSLENPAGFLQFVGRFVGRFANLIEVL
jgi:hypothetical protein